MPAPKGNKNAKGNKGGKGQKTKYLKIYSKQVYKAALLGAIDKDLAELFDVSERTILYWKKNYVEFVAALKKGREDADGNVAKSLYQRAIGYSHKDVDIRTVSEIGGGSSIVQTPLIKHYPPDTTAAIFWLKNRQPGKWRDAKDLNLKGIKAGIALEEEYV